MMLCRKAPRAFTALFTSIRCSSLTPGIITELILVRMPRAVSISRPSIWRSVQDAGGLDAVDALVVVEDPRVDLRADLGVHHVDGDGDVVDVVFGDLVDVVRQRQAVGGQAQLDVRRVLLRDQFEGLEGLRRIGQRVAGAGDAEHRHLRNGRGHRHHLLDRLFGRQALGDHAGAALVGAVVLAVAVVALDVAGRRHRDVHAGVVVVRLFGVAGMVLHLLPDFRRAGRSGPSEEPQLDLPEPPDVPQPLCSATCCMIASMSTPS